MIRVEARHIELTPIDGDDIRAGFVEHHSCDNQMKDIPVTSRDVGQMIVRGAQALSRVVMRE